MMNNKDIEIEQVVIGTIICHPSLLPMYSSKLSIDLFTEPSHQTIFETITNLWENEKPIDALIVIKELKKRGITSLDKYILHLISIVSSSAHIEYYNPLCILKFSKK